MSETQSASDLAVTQPAVYAQRRWLFWACFIALIATSFGFIIRVFVVNTWAVQFGLSETQKGEILGVGLWPFAISIVLFSLVIDRIGYGKAMAFAFVCHVSSVFITIFARDYGWLYAGTFINSLGNGTVEAVINPVVATMFPRHKTQWLNILHAGWPGGLVLGGLLTLSLSDTGVFAGRVGEGGGVWKWQVALVLIPAAVYGVMMLRAKFPVSERVAAGVGYRAMLQEAGFLGAFLVAFLIVYELSRVFLGATFTAWQWQVPQIAGFAAVVAAVIVLPYAIYVRFAPGRWLFLALLLLMIPLATTELGTDAWIKDLMESAVDAAFGISSLWVLIFSASVMMVLRFVNAPIVGRLGPLGVLAGSSALAAAGIAALSQAYGAAAIIVSATVYAVGQTFFWPTILGTVAERFPRGGAVTLNAIAGVGMLGVGILGAQFLGFVQDRQIYAQLEQRDPAMHAELVATTQLSLFGPYDPLDAKKVEALDTEAAAVVDDAKAAARRDALLIVAILPVGMCLAFLLLAGYFKARGGYRPVELEAAGSRPSPPAL